MAVSKGCYGKIRVKTAGASGAAALLARLKDWSIDEATSAIDASEMGSCVQAELAGPVKTSITIDVHWDPGATGQGLLSIGDTLYLEIYPGGSGSGAKYYKSLDTATGGAEITNINHAGNGIGGIVGSSISLNAKGGLTATGVP